MHAETPPKKASHQDWHPADIVAALHKRRTTLRKLAERHDRHPNTLTDALRRRSRPSEKLIADAIGVPPQEIWPSRYEKDGSRVDLRTVAGRALRVNGKRVKAD